MTKWAVVQSYLSGAPEEFEAPDYDQLLAQVQQFADAKRVRRDRPAIGPLDMEVMTDQVDFFFTRNGRRRRFLTLHFADE